MYHANDLGSISAIESDKRTKAPRALEALGLRRKAQGEARALSKFNSFVYLYESPPFYLNELEIFLNSIASKVKHAFNVLECKMAATSATTFSVRSTMSIGSKVSPISQPKAFGVRFNSKNCVKSFSGLKAATSGSCESDSSFLGKESSAALRDSCTPKAQKQYQRSWKNPQPQASYKVAVLGAAGGIGQPLALLIKMSPLVSNLRLYDIANVKGVAADLSHCNTPSQVLDFTGASELANCLKGVNVVVIPAGVPRKPSMTRDDLLNINANIVKTLVEAVADNCPDAFIHIISNPVNSMVPITAEVLKQKGEFLGNRV
ncbi:hypothetical protein TEA_024649 [Camellia sinensis var. sinensis]|uniref:malate dehydrogenase n=1 Tax=Camellia sinensis var. sinensis TaxID=542762 RepID=A0A4S4CYK7_CAMSN|nr:hypothetical protein TEA_024649 [Camellia sinensis var. sinensis]